jgi:hypothetical protein
MPKISVFLVFGEEEGPELEKDEKNCFLRHQLILRSSLI